MVGRTLSYIGLAIWIFHFFVWYQYDGTRPTRQDMDSGRIYPQNTHGHVVYLTKEENTRLNGMGELGLGLMLCGILTGYTFVDRFHWQGGRAPWQNRP
jgi:hypothetical protein